MKTKSILMLFAVACILSSCFNGIGSHSTPIVQLYYGYVNPQFVGDTILIGAKDTLKYNTIEELNMTYTDTLQLGDTVMIPAFFASNMNNLVSVSATADSARVNIWFDLDMQNDSTRNALMPHSKPEEGVIFFQPMLDYVIFPIYILPLEVGSHVIKVTVTSDSQYPTSSVIFTLPVIAPAAEEEGADEETELETEEEVEE